MPDGARLSPDGDPAEVAASRETLRLAFVAALQHLPPRQRAVLILCEVLRWKASEVAELLDTSVASVNSALQRARATLEASDLSAGDVDAGALDAPDQELLARFADAFERYDMDALTALIREDATQSMPPYELWLRGRDDILGWWVGPGAGCRGSRVIPTMSANGSPGVRPVQAERDGRGLRPVGAAGARDRGRQDRRVHVLPRHGARLPAVRPAAAAQRVASRDDDVGEAHQRRSGRAARACVFCSRTWQPRRRAASCSCASASTVTASAGDAAHVAQRDAGALRSSSAHTRSHSPGRSVRAIGP